MLFGDRQIQLSAGDLDMLFDLVSDNSYDGPARIQQLVQNGTAKNSGDRASWGRARPVEN